MFSSMSLTSVTHMLTISVEPCGNLKKKIIFPARKIFHREKGREGGRVTSSIQFYSLEDGLFSDTDDTIRQ